MTEWAAIYGGGRRAHFVDLIRRQSVAERPLPAPPLPPSFEALRGAPLPGLKAVLFDVYGTLFSSAAGEIGVVPQEPAGPGGEDTRRRAAGISAADRHHPSVDDGVSVASGTPVAGDRGGDAAAPGESEHVAAPEVRIGRGPREPLGPLDELARNFAPGHSGAELDAYFREAVLEEHRRLTPGVRCPEVRVEELWARFDGFAPGTDSAEFALRYELAVNPLSPMPGAAEVLAALPGAGLALGIVSNAQGFTPLLFDALLGGELGSLGFAQELLSWSAEARLAKPCPELFAPVRSALEARGIAPSSVLYVGNDMLNDVLTATRVGFRTCLFAGDGRSLRLRRDRPECVEALPDTVIRDLRELPALVAGGSG